MHKPQVFAYKFASDHIKDLTAVSYDNLYNEYQKMQLLYIFNQFDTLSNSQLINSIKVNR